jgi:flagellar hook-basal body complex protein FliE
MSYFKVTNNNHSIATDFYQRASKAIDKTNNLDRIQDIVSVGQDNKKFDFGGVEFKKNNLIEGKDILLGGDTIIKGASQALEEDRKKDSFMKALKAKFKALVKSEDTTRAAINYDTNILELTSSIKEAEQSLDFVVTCRDKLVNLWKDLLNTAI